MQEIDLAASGYSRYVRRVVSRQEVDKRTFNRIEKKLKRKIYSVCRRTCPLYDMCVRHDGLTLYPATGRFDNDVPYMFPGDRRKIRVYAHWAGVTESRISSDCKTPDEKETYEISIKGTHQKPGCRLPGKSFKV